MSLETSSRPVCVCCLFSKATFTSPTSLSVRPRSFWYPYGRSTSMWSRIFSFAISETSTAGPFFADFRAFPSLFWTAARFVHEVDFFPRLESFIPVSWASSLAFLASVIAGAFVSSRSCGKPPSQSLFTFYGRIPSSRRVAFHFAT